MQNMSWNAGGLAQMTYNNNNNYSSNDRGVPSNNNISNNNNFAIPGSGYASRGKNSHIKHLSVGLQGNDAYYRENEDNYNHHHNNNQQTPRTSRSHLLAGLRTVPKSPAPPASAPYNQQQHLSAQNGMQYTSRANPRLGREMPQTATGTMFSGLQNNNLYANGSQHMYTTPDQVLTPPALELGYSDADQIDPQFYDELMATNKWLVQRQQQLQQQLINVTAAANQFQGLSLGGRNQYNQQTPLTPEASLYGQQLQNGMQPVIQQVPNQPGVYTVYNPMTGQHSYFVDQSVQSQLPMSPAQTPGATGSPKEVATPNKSQRNAAAAPQPTTPWTLNKTRSATPPKHAPSPPQDVTPLPPPSATAFRPGHKKTTSVAVNMGGAAAAVLDNKMTPSKNPGTTRLPLSNNFGVGMARAGDLPSRQPRGPPPLEELIAAPTSRHEGSKNFATRQRRRALHSLVRAGNERLTGRSGSGDSTTPTSEKDVNLGNADADPENNLSARPSIGSLRAVANGAIGSERKASKERSRDRSSIMRPAPTRFSSCDEVSFANKLMESKPVPDNRATNGNDRRRMPMLVLTSAEKRKSMMY